MAAGGLFREDLLKGNYRPEVNAYYFKEWNGFIMPFHTHRATEIMYVITGLCRVELQSNGRGKQDVPLKKGEFIILDANVPHRLIVEASCRMLNIEFRFSNTTSIFPSMKELASRDAALLELFAFPHSHLVLREPHEIYHILKSLVMELDRKEADRDPLVQLLLSQLLIRIARLRQETENSGLDMQDMYVRQCLEFLRQNYDRDIQVKEIAASVNLHPGYLQRIFKSKTGATIMEYLTEYRMEKAKMLLQQTDIPVAEIADYVGVGSRQYLHFLFKKHIGATPVEYRKSVKAERQDPAEYQVEV